MQFFRPLKPSSRANALEACSDSVNAAGSRNPQVYSVQCCQDTRALGQASCSVKVCGYEIKTHPTLRRIAESQFIVGRRIRLTQWQNFPMTSS